MIRSQIVLDAREDRGDILDFVNPNVDILPSLEELESTGVVKMEVTLDDMLDIFDIVSCLGDGHRELVRLVRKNCDGEFSQSRIERDWGLQLAKARREFTRT